MNTAKNLAEAPPRSPRLRVGGYALLARMADKGRATLMGTAGEYHFDCPVDNLLFGFKGVTATEVRTLLATGASDAQIATWLDAHGTPKTAADVKAWSDTVEGTHPIENAEQRDWFAGECAHLGLNAEKATLFDYLEADDRASFGHGERQLKDTLR